MTDIFNTFLDIISKATAERNEKRNWFKKFKINREYRNRVKSFIKDLKSIEVLNFEVLNDFKKIIDYGNMLIDKSEKNDEWNYLHSEGGECYCEFYFSRVDGIYPSFRLRCFERDDGAFGGGRGGMIIIDLHNPSTDSNHRSLKTKINIHSADRYSKYVFEIMIAQISYYCDVIFDKVIKENLS